MTTIRCFCFVTSSSYVDVCCAVSAKRDDGVAVSVAVMAIEFVNETGNSLRI